MLSSMCFFLFSSCEFFNNLNKTDDVVEEKKEEGEIIPVESIELNHTKCDINIGKVVRLKYNIYPENATDKSITWRTEPQQSISFNDGVIRGIKAGTARITIVSKDNPKATASCAVIVREQETNSYQIKKMQYTYQNYADNHYTPIDSCPTTSGLNSVAYPKLLVLPVWFSDSSNYSEDREKVRKDIFDSFFGTNEDVGWYSVYTYYMEESLNSCQILGTVANWHETSRESSYFDDVPKSQLLIKEAVNNYFQNNPNDSKSSYDIDKDGFYDGVVVIYAAPDYKARYAVDKTGADNTNLWAYCFWMQEKNNSLVDGVYQDYKVNAYLWASYDFMYDSKKAMERAGSAYGSGVCDHVNLDTHIYIHEFGHILGLEDYYDYNGTSQPAGGFSMQDGNVGGHDPFSLLALGWVRPYIPIDSCEIKISPFQDTRELILLTPKWNKDNSVFEFYTPTNVNELDTKYLYKDKYPQGVNDYGIRLWHVDSRLAYFMNINSSGKYVFSNVLGNTNKDVASNNGVQTAMCNSYATSDPNSTEYCSVLGSEYYDYNILQLIKKNITKNNPPRGNFDNTDLFKENNSFNMNDYKEQFQRKGLLNSGLSLGFSFTVTKIDKSAEEATIKIKKITS